MNIEKEKYKNTLIEVIEKELSHAPHYEILYNAVMDADAEDVFRWHNTLPYANMIFVNDKSVSAEDRVSYFLNDLQYDAYLMQKKSR